ncbi:MAG: formimidoylglutamase [Bacteroidales bacterium]|nr:formimidoylglutamase [Bacteroidales bacterium]
MEILNLFDKIDPSQINLINNEEGTLNNNILCNSTLKKLNTADFNADIALIGLSERRGADKEPSTLAANNIRKEFYKLKQHNNTLKIIDLGNLKTGQNIKDTYYALSEVCANLFQNKIIPIIIGGSNDNAIGMYKGYEQIGQIINLINIDSRIDIKDLDKNAKDDNFLSHIFCSDPNYLFNYTHLAYQSYFVETNVLKLMQEIRFEAYRLGEIQSQLENSEPLIRNADMLIADINSIRASDAPTSDSPHGLYGEEFCKLLHYAGMNDKLTSLGLFNYEAEQDINNRTAKLISHALWYFIDGYLWRKNDFPYKDLNNYYRFNVIMENEDTIVFYKSKKSERWWMQINCNNETKEKYIRHYLIPCTYEDYKSAMENRIPDRWIIAYNKMNL